MTKDICQYCGWEVPSPEWYNYYDKAPLCDDCNMDMMVSKQRELENA